MIEIFAAAGLALQQKPPTPIRPNTWFGLRQADGNQENVLVVRLSIDAKGRVVECVTVEASLSPAYDAQACPILKHKARYEPALDRDGQATDATVFLALAATPRTAAPSQSAARFAGWLTSADYPPQALRAGEEGAVLVGWEITEQGLVENCQVILSSSSPSLDAATCAIVTTRGRYHPALDDKGNPMRSSAASRIIWALP